MSAKNARSTRSIVANSKDITSGRANILLIGDAGTWKTRFLGGVPGIEVLDFDAGMAINRDRAVEYWTFKEKARGEPPKKFEADNGIYAWGTAWQAMLLRINEIGARIDAGKGPKAIGLDSLTFFGEIALNKVASEQKDPVVHKGTYGGQINHMKGILSQLSAWPIRLVATAHIQRDTNDLTGVTEKLPLLTGKLAGLVAALFDEVYFCESEVQADGTQKFTVKTKATPEMRQAKSRWGVPNGTETSWEAISKYMPAAPAYARG